MTELLPRPRAPYTESPSAPHPMPHPPAAPELAQPVPEFAAQLYQRPERRAHRMPVDGQWFKRAVFYEMLVQAGADSNGDGYGDLPGLISRLDYFQWLGRRLPVAATVLRLAAARRRVRHPRLLPDRPRVRHASTTS